MGHYCDTDMKEHQNETIAPSSTLITPNWNTAAGGVLLSAPLNDWARNRVGCRHRAGAVRNSRCPSTQKPDLAVV
jgi:hypothetical protein